jgi:opacity protein-like surface antigen
MLKINSGNNMKKQTVIAASLLLGATLASAASSNTYVKSVALDVHVGASSVAKENPTTSNGTAITDSSSDASLVAYNFGFGMKKTFDMGIFIGGNGDYEYISQDGNNPLTNNDYAFYLDVRAGYTYSDISIYGIAGMRGAQGNGDFIGYGGGAGVEWQFTEHFAVSAEYKQYAMEGVYINYDYTVTGANIKYYF